MTCLCCCRDKRKYLKDLIDKWGGAWCTLDVDRFIKQIEEDTKNFCKRKNKE